MKKAFIILTALIFISAGIAFTAKSKESKKMLYKVKNRVDVQELFPTTAEQISEIAQNYIQEAQASLDNLIAIDDADRTYANTIRVLDEIGAFSNLAVFSGIAEVLQYTSPEESIRVAAHDAQIKIQEFVVDSLSNNVALYNAIKSYAENQKDTEKLTPQECYFLEKTMEDFKRNGLDLPADKLEQVKALKKELGALQLDFEANIAKDNRSITVKQEGLAGLSEEFINSLKKSEDGSYILGVDYPTFFTVMENCSIESTRKMLDYAFENRGYPVNESVLSKVIEKRDKLAQLLGFASFAEYDLGDQMVQSVERAEQFIYPLLEKAHIKEKQEFDELLTDLPADVHLTKDNKLKSWDFAYVKNQYKKKHYNIDEEKISEYFPMERTVKGLFDVYEKFLTLTLKEVPSSGYWHEDVKLIETYDAKSNQLLGYLLLDLYPRPNKFTHACHAGIIPSIYVGDHMVPGVSVVIANFPKSTATKPSLLKRKDVSTFFHEFGHALHALLGRTHVASLSGTSVKRDFVELPSQMLEEWLFDKEILQKVSGHYKTNESLPDDVIDRIITLKNFGAGKFLQGQLFYSLLALNLFKEGANKNVGQIFKDLYVQSQKNVEYDPENHMYASFGHLMGYGAKYYGYMWSKVFALDMFDTIKKHGLLNPEIGQKYVSCVIGKGGSEDPNNLLRDFLGREPNQDAFLRDMGLQIENAPQITAQALNPGMSV